jgi:hypothetical protein
LGSKKNSNSFAEPSLKNYGFSKRKKKKKKKKNSALSDIKAE